MYCYPTVSIHFIVIVIIKTPLFVASADRSFRIITNVTSLAELASFTLMQSTSTTNMTIVAARYISSTIIASSITRICYYVFAITRYHATFNATSCLGFDRLRAYLYLSTPKTVPFKYSVSAPYS